MGCMKDKCLWLLLLKLQLAVNYLINKSLGQCYYCHPWLCAAHMLMLLANLAQKNGHKNLI